jgi:hypothetical protein
MIIREYEYDDGDAQEVTKRIVLSMTRNIDRQSAGAVGICAVTSMCGLFRWRLPSHQEQEVSPEWLVSKALMVSLE